MRWLLALVVLAGLAVAAATIANHPGTVAITWQGWEIDTSVGLLVAASAVAAIVLWLGFSLITGLIRLPTRFRRNRRDRRRRAGEAALARGMIALAGGDAPAAQRQARRAGVLLAGSPPALLLAAQAAQLAGDEAEAKRLFTAMLDRKEVAPLGLRGLLGQALRDGDGDGALRLAERARQLRPNAGWAFEALLALQTRTAQWEAARDTLAAAARHHLLPAERARHHRGVILYELSLAAERDGDLDGALALAGDAAELTPDLATPTCRHARLLLARDRRRRARRAVEQAWSRAPHPELARVWAEIGARSEPLAEIVWVQRLAALNPEAGESDVYIAETALTAQLWGEARAHLTRAIAAAGPGRPPRRLCLLMARLEEGEYAHTDRARAWLDRALDSPPDPTYACVRCGHDSGDWHALCPHCRSFDTLAWRTTPDIAPVMVVLPAGPPPDSGPPLLAAAEQWDK